MNAILLRFHYKEKINRKCYNFVKIYPLFMGLSVFLLAYLLDYMFLLDYYKHYIHYIC